MTPFSPVGQEKPACPLWRRGTTWQTIRGWCAPTATATDVVVLGDESGLAVIGRGLAGRLELAVELLDPAVAGSGAGRRLIRGALAAMEPGEWCFAQVSPGNAASLRAFLACGFTPIGSEVLIQPTTGARGTEVPEG